MTTENISVTKRSLKGHWHWIWIPEKPRQHDVFLVEFFIAKTNNSSYLTCQNRCRFHLQLITLSDVSAANGEILIPCIKQGVPSAAGKAPWNAKETSINRMENMVTIRKPIWGKQTNLSNPWAHGDHTLINYGLFFIISHPTEYMKIRY